MVSQKDRQIRFKSFSKQWKKKKLGDATTIVPNNTLSRAALNYHSGLAKNIHYGDILVKYGEVIDTHSNLIPFVSDDDVANKFRHCGLQDGDVVMADAAEDEMVGKCTEIQNVCDKLVLSGLHTIALRPLDSFAPCYLGYYLNSNAFRNQLLRLMQGTKVLSISKTAIKETFIYFPTEKVEQKKIGKYFRELDLLIGLHQRKHDKLETLKKTLLQKMFPKPGATVPEIRFKGFSGDWVEKRLADIIDLGSGRDYKHLSPGDIPVYGTGGFMLKVNEALSTNMDAVGIGRKGTIDKPYILKAPFWTVDTLFYAIPKSENYLDFVYCVFQRIDWKQKDESTGVPSLSKIAINEVTVLSTTPKEQQKIGTYFRSLDKLISKHATQIQKINQIKASCLEKMFA